MSDAALRHVSFAPLAQEIKLIYDLYMAKAKVSTFSATARDFAMLDAVARYHGLNKSATIASLVRREFWRIFPAGTEKVRPDRGARVEGDR
jgi:hypothetical protein